MPSGYASHQNHHKPQQQHHIRGFSRPRQEPDVSYRGDTLKKVKDTISRFEIVVRPDDIFLFRFPPTNPCDPTSSTETKTSAIGLSKASKVIAMTSELKLHPCTTSSSRLPPQPSPPPKAPSPFTDDSFSEDYGSLPFTPRSYPPPFILPRTR